MNAHIKNIYKINVFIFSQSIPIKAIKNELIKIYLIRVQMAKRELSIDTNPIERPEISGTHSYRGMRPETLDLINRRLASVDVPEEKQQVGELRYGICDGDIRGMHGMPQTSSSSVKFDLILDQTSNLFHRYMGNNIDNELSMKFNNFISYMKVTNDETGNVAAENFEDLGRIIYDGFNAV
jgi:hypothetical protein